MKILVIGCNGQLGKSINDVVKNLPYEVILTSREKIDISNLEETKDKVKVSSRLKSDKQYSCRKSCESM